VARDAHHNACNNLKGFGMQIKDLPQTTPSDALIEIHGGLFTTTDPNYLWYTNFLVRASSDGGNTVKSNVSTTNIDTTSPLSLI